MLATPYAAVGMSRYGMAACFACFSRGCCHGGDCSRLVGLWWRNVLVVALEIEVCCVAAMHTTRASQTGGAASLGSPAPKAFCMIPIMAVGVMVLANVWTANQTVQPASSCLKPPTITHLLACPCHGWSDKCLRVVCALALLCSNDT